MWPVPMIAYKTRDEEFGSNAVGFGEVERVVHQESVADGFVDYAVEDMC
jgi:hypothetical protein